jgi:hypothetical protein
MVNADLSSRSMQAGPPDLAQVRLDNALALFEEFVRQTARHADAATLRGLERRFAERLQIQPSNWSQIKGRSRQIGERLARQFEHLSHKPRGWMDLRHPSPTTARGAPAGDVSGGREAGGSPVTGDEMAPMDDDERFIVGLVLTYYRRHPQRARTRLLDLLGEVLTPSGAATAPATAASRPSKRLPSSPPSELQEPRVEDPHALWLRMQTGVAPLKRGR